MELKELTDKIQDTWAQMQTKNNEVLDEAKGAIKSLNDYKAEDIAEITKINAAMDAQKAQLDEIGLNIERQKLIPAGENEKEDEDAKLYESTFYKAMRVGDKNLDPDDRKILRHAMTPESKALVENTAGLYLVPQDLEKEIMMAIPQINTLRNYCRVRTTSRDKVGINSATEVSVSWGKLETGSDIDESTITPSRDTIYVEDMYGLTKVGEDELEDSDANLQSMLANSFATAFADAEAKAFAVGTGHATYQQPDGITLESISHTNWTAAGTASIDDLLDCEYGLGAQYLNGAVWLMSRTTELAIRVLRPETSSGYYGQYFWQPSLQAGQPNNIDGFGIINQNDMANSAGTTDLISVVFGNFKQGYTIVDRAGMAIKRLDELYAEAGLVGFRAKKRVGGGAHRTAAFYGIGNSAT